MSDRLELVIQDVVYPGKALSKGPDGKVVFVDEGIDGERVEAEVIKRYKTYDLARLISVIEPSPYRVPPRCDHYRLCSVYQVIDYPYQVRLKLRQLNAMMKGIYTQRIEFLPADRTFGYRNKVRFRIDWAGRKAGYVSSEGEVVDVEECHLALKEINQTWKRIRSILWDHPLEEIESVEIRADRNGRVLVNLFVSDDTPALQDLAGRIGGLESVAGVVRIKGLSVKELVGERFLEVEVAGRRFRFYATNFFQVNYEMAEKVIGLLREWILRLESRVILDLFAGVGFLGLSVADAVRWVYAVESDPLAGKALEVNGDYAGFGNLSYKIGNAGKIVWEVFEDPRLKKSVDTVVVDPPRTGLSKSVREFLRKNRRVRSFVYVSCDPMTLRRDLLELKSVYKVEKMYVVDMFPNTPHIETFTVLTRRKR